MADALRVRQLRRRHGSVRRRDPAGRAKRATACSAIWNSTACESPCCTATNAAGFAKRSTAAIIALVCYGHTHVAAIDRHGETLVVNPGAIYRADPHSVAVVDLPAVEATIVEL